MALFIKNNNPITIRVITEKLADQRIGHNNDFGFRKSFSQSAHGRGGHDRIANPVGRTHHDLLYVFAIQGFQRFGTPVTGFLSAIFKAKYS
jgi:hypothetical protein